MSTQIQKLFVRNLPWTVGHAQLKNYFSEFGKVLSASVIFDKKTGISKNYGFVVVEKKALENLEKKGKHKLENNYIFYQSSN